MLSWLHWIWNTLRQSIKGMIFCRPKSYSITLKCVHTLLEIPRDPAPSIHGREVTQCSGIPSRDQIQDAFRKAAKRHHPDTVGAAAHSRPNANKAFRECNDARELLLDYYVRRRFVPPEVVESIEDIPVMDESLFSIWTST